MSSKRRRSRKPAGNTTLPPPDEFARQVVELIGQEQAAQLRRDMEYVMERAKSPLWRKVFEDCGDPEYADAIYTYLSMAVSNFANFSSSFCRWENRTEKVTGVFSMHAIPMIWDYAEVNPYSDVGGSFMSRVEYMAKAVERLPADVNQGHAYQWSAERERR